MPFLAEEKGYRTSWQGAAWKKLDSRKTSSLTIKTERRGDI